jgi:hypothetical protein
MLFGAFWHRAGGRLELIAGQVAKPTRPDRKRFAPDEFHAGMRDTGQWSQRMRLLKPRRRLRRVTLGSQLVVNGLSGGGTASTRSI